MGWWSGRVATGFSPEAIHGCTDIVHPSGIIAIDPTTLGFLINRELHHEGLDRNRSPGIEDRKTKLGLTLLQCLFSPEQALHNTGTQAKRICIRAIGRTDGDIGVWFQPQQLRGQRQQWLMAIRDRSITPGTHDHSSDPCIFPQVQFSGAPPLNRRC